MTDRFAAVAGEPTGGQPASGGSAPDLGFFAGAPSGPSNQFGTPPAPPQFGSPPAPPQFGTPTPFGAPAVPPPPSPSVTAPRPSASRTARRVVGALVLLVVLGALGVGRFSGLAGFLAGDLELPATVLGMPHLTDPELQQASASIVDELERKNSGDAVAGYYGDASDFLFVLGQRTRVDIDREMADGGVTGATRTFGDVTCGTIADGSSLCLRTSASTSIGAGGSVSLEQAAAAVNEVWAAQ